MGIFKLGLKQAGTFIFAAILSLFLCVSIMVICTGVFTKEIGYTAHVYEDEDGKNFVEKYEYRYTDKDGDGKDDGVDQKLEKYKEKDYYLAINKERSSLTGVGKGVFFASTQIIAFIITIAFAANACYKQGFKETNLVKIGKIKEDKLKGLKIGLIGNIPFFALFAAYAVMALGWLPQFKTVWYAFLNAHFYPLIMLISGSAAVVSDLKIWQFALLFALQLIVPVISMIAYILGYKGINISEKIVYKKEVK